MRHHDSLPHDLLKWVPWTKFDRLVDKHGTDRSIRKLSTKSQFVALPRSQFAGAVSLRDTVSTLASHEARLHHVGAAAPKRSTLADANAKRPAAFFADLFSEMLGLATPGQRQSAKGAVSLIDSTSIRLDSLSKDWASYQALAP